MRPIEQLHAKMVTWQECKSRITEWKQKKQKIVFTNGCFDLLHPGHLHYLAEAKHLGDKLVIGLNSDASVKRLKGASRPVNSESSRQLMLAALEFVDLVTLFKQDTPLELIQMVLPDILVKGGDWKPEQIIGSKEVLANQGAVYSLPFLEGYSSTGIIEKIKRTHHENS